MALRERSANAAAPPALSSSSAVKQPQPSSVRALPGSPCASHNPRGALTSASRRGSGQSDAPDVLSVGSAGASLLPTVAGPAGSAGIRTALERESRHELVALMGRELTVNWANYNAFKAEVDSAPVMVVSFLGDTSVGKSTTISALMSSFEDKPHVQRGRDQTRSTTGNVNLYASAALGDRLSVNFLDFEGEAGSETPMMVGGGSGQQGGVRSTTARLLGLAAGVLDSSQRASPLARAEAVRDLFPKLAYCMSDVIVLIGIEPFFST